MTSTSLEAYLSDFIVLTAMIFVPTYIILSLINRKHTRNRINADHAMRASQNKDPDMILERNYKEIVKLIINEARVYELPLNAQLRKGKDKFKIDSPSSLIERLLKLTFDSAFLSESDLRKRDLTEIEVKFAALMICLKTASLKSESKESIQINSYVATAKNTPYSLAIVQRLCFLIGINLFYALKAEEFSRIQKNPVYYDKLLDRAFVNIDRL